METGSASPLEQTSELDLNQLDPHDKSRLDYANEMIRVGRLTTVREEEESDTHFESRIRNMAFEGITLGMDQDEKQRLYNLLNPYNSALEAAKVRLEETRKERELARRARSQRGGHEARQTPAKPEVEKGATPSAIPSPANMPKKKSAPQPVTQARPGETPHQRQARERRERQQQKLAHDEALSKTQDWSGA